MEQSINKIKETLIDDISKICYQHTSCSCQQCKRFRKSANRNGQMFSKKSHNNQLEQNQGDVSKNRSIYKLRIQIHNHTLDQVESLDT